MWVIEGMNGVIGGFAGFIYYRAQILVTNLSDESESQIDVSE